MNTGADIMSFVWVSISALIVSLLASFLLVRFFLRKKPQTPQPEKETEGLKTEIKYLGKELALLRGELKKVETAVENLKTVKSASGAPEDTALPLAERIAKIYNQSGAGNWEKALAGFSHQRVVVPDLAGMEEKVAYRFLTLEPHPSGELILISGEGNDFLVPLPGISLTVSPKLFKNFFNLPQGGGGKIETLLRPALISFDRSAGKCEVLQPGELKFRDETYAPANRETLAPQESLLPEMNRVKVQVANLQEEISQLGTQIIKINTALAELAEKPAPTQVPAAAQKSAATPPSRTPGPQTPAFEFKPETPGEDLALYPAWLSELIPLFNREKSEANPKSQFGEKLNSQIKARFPELKIQIEAWQEAGYQPVEYLLAGDETFQSCLPLNLEMNYKEAAGQRFTAKFLQQFYNPPAPEASKAFIERLESPVILQNRNIVSKGRIKYREERI